MKKWKIWVGILVLFLSGATLGAMGTVMYVHHHIRSMVKEGPNAFNKLVMMHLDEELDLSDDQEAAVLQIITETHHKLLHFRAQHEPHLHGIIEDGIKQIKSHLEVDQQKKVDELFQELHGEHSPHLENHVHEDSHAEQIDEPGQ